MFATTNQQIFSVVSGGYVPEHHGEPTQSYLPALDRESVFDEILKSLRSALSCHRRRDQ